MKAAWSIGRNRPDDFRSFATTLEISRGICIDRAVRGEVGMAIGIAWMLRLGNVELNHRACAMQGCGGCDESAQEEACDSQRAPLMHRRRSEGRSWCRIAHAKAELAAAIHLSWVEIEDHVAPHRVFLSRQLVGLALVDRAHGAVRPRPGRRARSRYWRPWDSRSGCHPRSTEA